MIDFNEVDMRAAGLAYAIRVALTALAALRMVLSIL
jgi:hypothetical protein